MLSLPILYSLFASLTLSRAATADEWRGRSIYQVITDRFAHPAGSTPPECDTGSQTWCGGTWKGILDHLDYIQDAGFTAIWISPVNKNYEGPRTAYGDPYHGYWVTDVSQLNSKFGTSDDLHALVDGLHRRGMYIMVDVVVNHVMATSTTPDYSDYFFKDASFYHPYCPIDYSNATSTELCWMGDERVPLPDVDTSNPTVIERYGQWIQNFVKEYKIDGLRIDALWRNGKPSGPANITGLISVFEESRKKFKDTTLLGNFLENHDVPRWHNLSVDPQSLYNAMAWNFLTEGIPIVYYGQEHGLSGAGDPHNREALWPTQYTNSTGYNFTTTLNQFRNFLVNSTDWLKQETQILTTSPQGVAFLKGNVVSILTNIGSPPQPQTHIAVKTPYSSATALTNILTCQQWVVGTQGAVEVQYSLGGVPVILMPSSLLDGSGMCGAELDKVTRAGGRAVPLNGSAISSSGLASSSLVALLLAALSALLL
ncbi:alpha-amylase [Coprinopsis sp. MPI-PUGE-AT-0042]|nr:alpha-amylase [Coprinopsis sp. MPI-PUGE-AT-0042]